MTKDESQLYVKHKALVVEQVLTWLVRDIALYRYHNSTNYLTRLKQVKDQTTLNEKKIGNYYLKELSTMFHFDEWFIGMICGPSPRIDKRRTRMVEAILDLVKKNSTALHYVGKKDVVYKKSGKKFSHLGWWMLDTREATNVLSDSSYDSKADTSRYCDEARYVISKFAFRYSQLKMECLNSAFNKLQTEQENIEIMTKLEKDTLREECERGLHCLPYDDLVKRIEREEKTKLRTLQTRIRKFTQAAMIELQIENEKLKAENLQLKADIEHLKTLKDLDSDIPADDMPTVEEINAQIDAALSGEACPPTHVFEAPKELAKKEIWPDDDLPVPSPEEKSKLERQLGRLQEFIVKHYISLREAKSIESFFKRQSNLKETRDGFSPKDAFDYEQERKVIFGYFRNEVAAHGLDTKLSAEFFKTRC